MSTGTATKIYWIPASVTLALMFGGVWASTQWVASLLDYQTALGNPLLTLGSTPIYSPKFLAWWWQYGSYAPQQFDKAAFATYGGVFAGLAVAFGSALNRAKGKNKLTSHGTARWADKKDIEKSGLLGTKGVVFGMTEDGRYLRHDGPEHLLVMAPTRGGKGTGIIIPSLLTWSGSVLVTDLKGENYLATAGYRQQKMKNKILRFDPVDNSGTCAKFNPLNEIRARTKNEVRDAQNLADMLVDPNGSGQLDHWAKTGHALLTGVTLHLKYTQSNATLASMATFLSDPTRTFPETLQLMMTTTHDSSGILKEIYGSDSPTHPVVAQSARELLNKSANELSGVLSTAMSFLGLYRDPLVAANTCQSDFAVTDLMDNDNPVSLYIVIPTSDANRLTPLTRLILSQILRRLTENPKFEGVRQVPSGKHRLLLLIDEFPALGQMKAISSGISVIAGYGLKCLLIVQSLNQLYETYSKNNSIRDNCHIQIFYTPNDENTPEIISKALGSRTEIVENRSYQGNRLNLWLGRANVSQSEIARPLMTPAEIKLIPKDREIVFIAGVPPILARKIAYHQDKNFTKRILAAPDKSDRLVQPITPASTPTTATTWLNQKPTDEII